MPREALCKVCNYRLDPIWVEIGEDTHPNCKDLQCEHGEPRGIKFCAICRRKAAQAAEGKGQFPPMRPVDTPTVAVGMDHPTTSLDAAARAKPGSGTKRALILEAIANSADGMTDFEIEDRFAWKHESASAARRTLVMDGWLINSGRTRKVPDTGNPAIVWIAYGGAH